MIIAKLSFKTFDCPKSHYVYVKYLHQYPIKNIDAKFDKKPEFRGLRMLELFKQNMLFLSYVLTFDNNAGSAGTK